MLFSRPVDKSRLMGPPRRPINLLCRLIGPLGPVQGLSGPAYKLGACFSGACFAGNTSSKVVPRFGVHIPAQINLQSRLIWLQVGWFGAPSTYFGPSTYLINRYGFIASAKVPRDSHQLELNSIPRHKLSSSPGVALNNDTPILLLAIRRSLDSSASLDTA